MYRKKGRGWTKHIDFMLIDIACIVIAFFISYVIRFGFNNPYMDKDYRILGVAFLLIDFFVEIMADSFKNVLKRGYLDELISTCKHAMLVFLATALFLFTTQMADIYSRLSFYIMFPIYVTISYVARIALKSFLKKKGFGASKKSLLVIAPDAMLRDTLRTVEKSCIGYTRIVAASLDTDMKGKTICSIPIVANHDGIVDYACDEWVDEVLIPPCSEDEYPEKMADIFLEMGIAVHTGIAKNGTAQGGYKQIEKIGDYTVVTSSVNYANTSALLVKRGMDIVGGLVGCLFTLIIMIFVGPMIYIASPGPIFFSQERIGRNGRKFKMYKFRSMYMDAEERKKELAAQNKVGDGMMFKMDFDPRIIGNKVLPNGKNKYAIIEYISDIAEYTDKNGDKLFKVLLLTHNFDFYRTVASRITKHGNSYIAFSSDGEIKFEKGQYTKNIFSNYKERLTKKYGDNIMVASIQFVRNLIEYTEDDNNTDYLLLTSVLHYKTDTQTITLKQIQDIFNQYWCKNDNVEFAVGRENDLIYNVIMAEADKIVDVEKLEIENKLILSMAIRLKAELYMKDKILADISNGSDIMSDIYSKKNQSAWLTKAYKQYINDDAMNTLELVAMITPENIHINSFMFEPILDMSIKQLYGLYQNVKALKVES